MQISHLRQRHFFARHFIPVHLYQEGYVGGTPGYSGTHRYYEEYRDKRRSIEEIVKKIIDDLGIDDSISVPPVHHLTKTTMMEVIKAQAIDYLPDDKQDLLSDLYEAKYKLWLLDFEYRIALDDEEAILLLTS